MARGHVSARPVELKPRTLGVEPGAMAAVPEGQTTTPAFGTSLEGLLDLEVRVEFCRKSRPQRQQAHA